MHPSPLPHYRELLRQILEERIRLNRRYSLRAFARALGLSASQLSRILSGKTSLSAVKAESVAAALFLNETKRTQFVNLVLQGNLNTPDPGLASFLYRKLEALDEEELDQHRLRCLSDWSVVVTFDAFALASPPRSFAELATFIGIAESEAALAIRQLEHAQLLEAHEGWYRRKVNQFYTPKNVPSAVVRGLHRQFIGKAMQAIEGQDVSRRYLRGKTVALRADLLPKVRELIEGFCSEMEKIEELSAGSANALYQLNVQWFDLLEASPPSPEQAKKTLEKKNVA